MASRLRPAAFLAALSVSLVRAQQPDQTPPPDFRQLLQKLAAFSPDACDMRADQSHEEAADIETRIFFKADEAVVQGLNASHAKSPRERAAAALQKLERMSAEINAAWPADNRFYAEITDLPPILIVRLGIRTRGTFTAFAIPADESGKSNQQWRGIRSGDLSEEHSFRSGASIYPLHRGPSGFARFLVQFDSMGCAGSFGVSYEAYEWNPQDGYLTQIIKQDGSFGLDDKVPDFPQIGKLQTKGTLITLPYCWFSPIDTWDNPSLCAVDTYDLSGDRARFRSRTYNRPDLLPIAKAIEYAQHHDYPAVLAYCASSQIARRLVRDFPASFSAENVQVSPQPNGRERVELGFETKYRFEVQKQAGRWRIVSFTAPQVTPAPQ